MAASRSAAYTIKGFIYQFLSTIENIMVLGDDTFLEVEGIEDIDVHTSTGLKLVQCKYHETKKFAPSLVYKPVGLMLTHYIENISASITYRLYAHFGENSPVSKEWLTSAFLKKALVSVGNAIVPTDEQLTEFSNRFEFSPGLSLEEQETKVKGLLRAHYSCSGNDVDCYYYNNAIAHIASISAQKNSSDRNITKQGFSNGINKKAALFDAWLRDLNGKAAYLTKIKGTLDKIGALKEIKRRFLYLPQEFIKNAGSQLSIEAFVHELSTQYPYEGQLYNTQLWTVIIDLPSAELSEVKAHLINNGIHYNDGYEDFSFSQRYFNDMPVISRSKTGKIIKTSHRLRVISAETFSARLNEVHDESNKLPHVFFDLSRAEPGNQSFTNISCVSVIRLPAVQDFVELIDILKLKR